VEGAEIEVPGIGKTFHTLLQMVLPPERVEKGIVKPGDIMILKNQNSKES